MLLCAVVGLAALADFGRAQLVAELALALAASLAGVLVGARSLALTNGSLVGPTGTGLALAGTLALFGGAAVALLLLALSPPTASPDSARAAGSGWSACRGRAWCRSASPWRSPASAQGRCSSPEPLCPGRNCGASQFDVGHPPRSPPRRSSGHFNRMFRARFGDAPTRHPGAGGEADWRRRCGQRGNCWLPGPGPDDNASPASRPAATRTAWPGSPGGRT